MILGEVLWASYAPTNAEIYEPSADVLVYRNDASSMWHVSLVALLLRVWVALVA